MLMVGLSPSANGFARRRATDVVVDSLIHSNRKNERPMKSKDFHYHEIILH